MQKFSEDQPEGLFANLITIEDNNCYKQYVSSFLYQHVFALCLLFLLI
jgi:hypothetical protein